LPNQEKILAEQASLDHFANIGMFLPAKPIAPTGFIGSKRIPRSFCQYKWHYVLAK
jgi:hypothetical protein